MNRRDAKRVAMGTSTSILRFGSFELDPANRQLLRHGVPVELGSRYFDALMLLAERQGELVTKDEFMGAVWQGIPVTDEALTQCIRTLRRILDDDASNPRFIQTVPKHGYRFIGSTSATEHATISRRNARVAGLCTIAGLLSGMVAGLFYGIIAGTGGAGQVLILAAMTGMLGLLAGAGLGTSMAAAMHWRGRVDYWTVIGAMIGGFAVGSIGNLLSREGVGLLSGVSVLGVTGPFEGLVLGCAVGFAGRAAFTAWHRRTSVAAALTVAVVAGGLIHVSNGTLLAGSLWALQQALPGTQLAIEHFGGLIGEPGFTSTTKLISAIVEAVIFVLAMTTALLICASDSEKG